MMDVFWGITLALWAYVLIPSLLVLLLDWVKDKRQIRRDRKRIDKLMADAEAVREQYHTRTDP